MPTLSGQHSTAYQAPCQAGQSRFSESHLTLREFAGLQWYLLKPLSQLLRNSAIRAVPYERGQKRADIFTLLPAAFRFFTDQMKPETRPFNKSVCISTLINLIAATNYLVNARNWGVENFSGRVLTP